VYNVLCTVQSCWGAGKENIWLKKEIEKYDDEKCHLRSFLTFMGSKEIHQLLCVHIRSLVCISKLLEWMMRGVGVELVSLGTHKS
jgi:hypothetical protein